MHDATRRLVLQAADGVAFIADSQRSEAAANQESFLNLKRNLEENGMPVGHWRPLTRAEVRGLVTLAEEGPARPRPRRQGSRRSSATRRP